MAIVLQPVDVPVSLSLAARPRRTFADLGSELGISPSTAHASVQRLNAAGLVHKNGMHYEVNLAALEEFLLHGVRYAFPPQTSRRKRGVPTAHNAPALYDLLGGETDPWVWPSAQGTNVGVALEPLIPSAVEFPKTAPQLYELLTLVDAIRVGTARDREIAGELLGQRLKDMR